jgi:hypothetical protein
MMWQIVIGGVKGGFTPHPNRSYSHLNVERIVTMMTFSIYLLMQLCNDDFFYRWDC